MEKLKVTQVRSSASKQKDQGATLRALGLRRIRDQVEVDSTPATLGMIRKVAHLVRVETVKGSKP